MSLQLTYDTAKQKAAVAASVSPKDFGDLPSFGGLWMSSLHRRLAIGVGEFGINAHRGDGHIVSFAFTNGAYTTDADATDQLKVVTGGYQLTVGTSKSIETYNSVGQLTSISTSQGNTLSLSYSNASTPRAIAPTSGYLLAVTDNTGRSIRFEYALPAGTTSFNDAHVSKITDPSGQTITPAYDSNGNLISLTWPDTKTKTFLYENAALPWALTGVVDENTSRFATIGYDATGNAISSELAGGVDKYVTSYATPPQAQRTQFIQPSTGFTQETSSWSPPVAPSFSKPNGSTSSIGSTSVQGMTLLSSMSQPAGSGCAASTSAQTYDTAANITSHDDFSGNRTCYAFDAKNQETTRVEGLATNADCATVLPANATLPANARKTSTSYHPDWRLATVTSTPGSVTTSIYQGQSDPFSSNQVANCTAAPNMPNGKPLPLLCKQVIQATLPSGALDTNVANATTQYSYDAAGRILTAKDALNATTTYSYYSDTSFTINSTAPYDANWDSVGLLLHGDGVSGSSSFVDSSSAAKTLTAVGPVTNSAVQSKFGGASIAFNGASYLSVSDPAGFSLGNSDFAVEAWVYPTSIFGLYSGTRLATIAAQDSSNSRAWWFRLYSDTTGITNIQAAVTADGSTFVASTGATGGATAILLNQWSHIAMTKSGGYLRTFVNGVLANQSAISTVVRNSSSPVTVGGLAWAGWESYFPGFIDDLRITIGANRYASNFTPPIVAFANNGLMPDPADVGHRVGDLSVITNPAGHATQFTKYDRAGRLLESVDPKGIVTTMTYTPRGWVSTVTTTAPGQTARTTTYSYDGVGQLTGVSNPDGSTLAYTYDAAHRLIGATDAKGNSVTYTLDNMGNRIKEDIKDPSGVLQRSIDRSFDALNRLQQVSGAVQ